MSRTSKRQGKEKREISVQDWRRKFDLMHTSTYHEYTSRVWHRATLVKPDSNLVVLMQQVTRISHGPFSQ